jgi:hypothetical protein
MSIVIGHVDRELVNKLSQIDMKLIHNFIRQLNSPSAPLSRSLGNLEFQTIV